MHIYLNLKVLQEEGFNLLGLATFILTFHQAEEFLDVYRCIGCLLNSVCKNIHQRSCWGMGWKCDTPQQWSMSSSSGIEAEHKMINCTWWSQLGGDGDLVERLRELSGPPDPAVAKLIRPKSLRARFGHLSHGFLQHLTQVWKELGQEWSSLYRSSWRCFTGSQLLLLCASVINK